MISKVICAYVSILRTSGCTNPYFFSFSQKLQVQTVEVSRLIARRFRLFSKFWQVLNVREWCLAQSMCYSLKTFFSLLLFNILLYALCGNYEFVLRAMRECSTHFRSFNVRQYYRLNSYLLYILSKKESYISFRGQECK